MNNCRKVLFGIFVFIIIVLVVINVVFLDNDKFWMINFEQALTLLIALVIGYYFVKKNQDENYKREIMIDILKRIQESLDSEIMFKFKGGEDINAWLIKKRSVNNYITILENKANEFKITKEIQDIKDWFEEYENAVSSHLDDLDYLKKSVMDFKRPLELMSSKIIEVMLKIYN